MNRRIVAISCAAAFAIGVFFIFVWAPHPWGWEGFDNYHEFGRVLARGEPFPTVDQPWGYAYFLAVFYRLFGDRPAVPLVVQAALNALLPLFVYLFARSEFDEQTATVSAVLTGLFSFNTVYASTQASDAVCTVIFIAGVLLAATARHRDDWHRYAAAGLLFGLAPQFRPNLILIPAVVGLFLVLERRTALRARGAVLLVATSILMLVPWTIRNERLTGELMPTSTHSGVQLWYGTLQTGPYLASRSYNPRSVFEQPSFPYTSLDHVPLVVTGQLAACASGRTPVLVYRIDDQQAARVPMSVSADGRVQAEMAARPAPATYYFYVDGLVSTGHPAPSVFFVSDDHFGDIDRHNDLLDVFDIVRLMRHVAWNDPVPAADWLDFDHDGRLTENDLRGAADALLAHAGPAMFRDSPTELQSSNAAASLRFGDGSTLSVPRAWSGRVTDLDVRGNLAALVLHTSVPFAKLRAPQACGPVDDLAVNAVYYRAEPQAMRRDFALALDNIRRDPGGYAMSVAYRAVRVFLIEGSADMHTAYQFNGSDRIYRTALVVSIVFLVLFVIGIVAAWRRGAAIAMPLVLIAYIPATLAFVLTNMRYSITVQPLMFVFVAAGLVSAAERLSAAPRHADTERVRRP